MTGRGVSALGRILRADEVRWKLRNKLLRAIEEVVAPGLANQAHELERLRQDLERLADRFARTTELLSEKVGDAGRQVTDQIVGLEVRSRRDLIYAADARSARESADFVRDNMTNARQLSSPHATLEHGLTLAPSGGMALEFGVYTGTTLRIIAEARNNRSVYGFDSFEGLPENWRPGFGAGSFAVDSPPVVPGAELMIGLFDQVLPDFLRTHPGPIDFLHIDADLYSSATTILTHVGPSLRSGSVIVFDEFFNYPGWQDHEYRAWTEHTQRTATGFRYEAFTYDNEQVVISIVTPQAGSRPFDG